MFILFVDTNRINHPKYSENNQSLYAVIDHCDRLARNKPGTPNLSFLPTQLYSDDYHDDDENEEIIDKICNHGTHFDTTDTVHFSIYRNDIPIGIRRHY